MPWGGSILFFAEVKSNALGRFNPMQRGDLILCNACVHICRERGGQGNLEKVRVPGVPRRLRGRAEFHLVRPLRLHLQVISKRVWGQVVWVQAGYVLIVRPRR